MFIWNNDKNFCLFVGLEEKKSNYKYMQFKMSHVY